MFVCLFLTERESESRKKEREIPSSLHEPDAGLELTNREIVT